MCGRYFLQISLEKLENNYGALNILCETKKYKREVFPSNLAPVIYNKEKQRSFSLMKWGFKPSFSDSLVINARSETVHKKKLFKESFHTRRCLIPANGFYEWKDEAGKRLKYYVNLKNRDIISLAGIYDRFKIEGSEEYAFCILTKDAPPELREIHDRIPVIIKEKFTDEWLENKFTPRIFEYLKSKGLDFKIKIL